jgi:outer membrane receptor protein involved in Fe transport
MITNLISLTVAALALASLTSCTTTTPTTATDTSTRPVYTTEKKSYPKEELDKRGRQTPGEALAAQDPSITYTGRH